MTINPGFQRAFFIAAQVEQFRCNGIDIGFGDPTVT